MHTCSRTCTCTQTLTHTRTHTHIRTLTHTCTHTHTCTAVRSAFTNKLQNAFISYGGGRRGCMIKKVLLRRTIVMTFTFTGPPGAGSGISCCVHNCHSYTDPLPVAPQCAGSHRGGGPDFPGQELHPADSPPPPLSRPCSCELFLISNAEEGALRLELDLHGVQNHVGRRRQDPHKRRLRQGLREVIRVMRKMRSNRRQLCREVLENKYSPNYNTFCFICVLQFVCERTSYTYPYPYPYPYLYTYPYLYCCIHTHTRTLTCTCSQT
jgi:hypothetical protein